MAKKTEYINKLSEMIRAEVNRETAYKESTRQTAQLRREQGERILKLEKIAKQMEELLKMLYGRPLAHEAIREWMEEFSERMERIERATLLILATTCKSSGAVPLRGKVNQVMDELSSQQFASIERQLRAQIKNLSYLREQAAQYGSAHVPVHVSNQIEEAINAVANLQRKLDEYDNDL